jgi:ParB family chromosome partitioning protein
VATNRSKGLGRGLGALISASLPTHSEAAALPDSEGTTRPSRRPDEAGDNRVRTQDAVVRLPIEEVYPNPDQPRKLFDQEELASLADSIRESGVIVPIIVTKTTDGYRIVAGERRWRASKLAEQETIPAIIRELSELQVLQQALIENIQRKDLSPLEEAESLKRLIDEYSMKQEEISRLVGRSRPAIANILRLLNLSETVKGMLTREELTAGHARALLAVSDEREQIRMARLVSERRLSVRETETLVKQLQSPEIKKPVDPQPDKARLLSIKAVEERCTRALGTKVRLKDKKNKGVISIEYYSAEDLDRIIELFESAAQAHNG